MKPQHTPVTVTLKVHPDHCKTFPDPNGKGRKRVIAQVSVDEICTANVDFGPNPRNQNTQTKVSQAISEGLTTQPGWFLYFNRGIVLHAKSVEYDNQAQELKLEFSKDTKTPWESPFGNLDGGHTNRVIIDNIRKGWRNSSSPGEKQYVTLEVLYGIEEAKLSDLVGARNTNMPVQDLSLLVLADKIDWLRNIFEEKNVASKVSWRQFEAGAVMGIDVIATLSLLNPNLEFKTKCYNGPGRIISELKAKPDLMEGLKSIRDVAFEYLKFVDYIHAQFEEWYREVELKGGKKTVESSDGRKSDDKKKKSGFGNLAGISIGGHELVFLGKTLEYKLVKAWLLPLAFAFTRVVLKERENPKIWHTIADRIGPKLYSTLRAQTADMNFNLDKLGKSAPVWDNLEAIVWAEYATHKLEMV